MQYFVAYMPYLTMKDVDEIDFGFAKVWNFDKKKDVYIKDLTIKAKLESILGCYTNNNNQVRNIGIISIGNTDFRIFTEKEQGLIRLIRLILFICFISDNNTHRTDPNTGHHMATSENFDIIFQNFVLENNFFAETVGEVVTFRKGGFNATEVKIQTPSHVPNPCRFTLDNSLFGALLKMRKEKSRVFRKIINSIEIFLESYYNSHHLSHNARILLQMSSFEILLDLPETAQRADFKKKIEKYTASANEKTYESYWSKKERKASLPKEFLSIKGIWAEAFYLLRNAIIHGNTPTAKSFYFKKQYHIHIATLFFVKCIKMQVEKSFKSFMCLYDIEWQTWTDDISDIKPFKRSEFVYKYSITRSLRQIMRDAGKQSP